MACPEPIQANKEEMRLEVNDKIEFLYASKIHTGMVSRIVPLDDNTKFVITEIKDGHGRDFHNLFLYEEDLEERQWGGWQVSKIDLVARPEPIRANEGEMSTFYAVSTTNFQMNGYEVFGVANERDIALAQAEELISQEIYADTLGVNLIVISKTKAIRKYGLSDWTQESFKSFLVLPNDIKDELLYLEEVFA